MIKISPSLLASDIANLSSEIKKIENCTDMLHIDVMDGHFVPNLSFGVPVVNAINKITDLTLDVHLMIEHPLKYIEPFAKAGADIITVHIECPDDANECIKLIKSLGLKAGIALNPNTPPSKIAHLADKVDMVLQMTVYPGFGGQSIEKCAIENISAIRKMIGNDVDLQVDGGIYASNLAELVRAGANVIVAGTAIFGASDSVFAVSELRNEARRGEEV